MKILIKKNNLFSYLFLLFCLVVYLPALAEDLSQSEIILPIDLSNINSAKELENAIENQIISAVESLENRWIDLSIKTDTYEKYLKNKELVSSFYETIVNNTKEILITLREDCVIYANFILKSDLSSKNKYKSVDDISDLIYDDLCDDIFDNIYNGILDDMFDFYYDGILNDAPAYVNYSEWSDVLSNEYSQWSDASSDVYKLWNNASSDIFSFCNDLSSKLFSEDIEGAEKKLSKFTDKIEKLKGNNVRPVSNTNFNTEVVSASNTDELENIILNQVESCIQNIFSEWDELSSEIDTFEKYQNNVEKVENFYEQTIYKSSQILIMIREYSVLYGEMICSSGASNKDMYTDFKAILDITYDDACSLIRDDIYDGLLNDIKDYYYDGIIKDAKDSVRYSDWSEARSDAYKMWSNARSDVYRDWADARSDIYKFISDTRSELYSGDMEDVQKKIQRFKDKIEKMK